MLAPFPCDISARNTPLPERIVEELYHPLSPSTHADEHQVIIAMTGRMRVPSRLKDMTFNRLP